MPKTIDERLEERIDPPAKHEGKAVAMAVGPAAALPKGGRVSATAVGKAEMPAPNTPVLERVTPLRARPVRVVPTPTPKAPPELVRVRAIERGQYGLDIDIIIRNPQEVFDMATSHMRTYPLADGKTPGIPKEHPIADATIIETASGQYELPGWVELVEDGEAVPASDEESRGHARQIRGQISKEGGRNISVL